MRLIFLAVLILAAAAAAIWIADGSGIVTWATEQQRWFQNQMAGAVRALQSGDPGAYAALLGAAGAYGFVHALGPGHGKYLIGGVGLGTSVSATRLFGIAMASSLAQALWAILLVYGGFYLLEVSAHGMTDLAEEWLAPVSYLAIASVGLILVWRGAKPFLRAPAKDHGHHHHHHHNAQGDCGCGHAHGPTPDEVAGLSSFREGLALVASIAVRPCTGAIFLLVIAWQMDIRVAGAAAVVVMGLGTAGLTSLVAFSSVVARGVVFATADRAPALQQLGPMVQLFAGVLIVLISFSLLRISV